MKFAFQPLIDLHSKTLLGFEALARFDDGRGPHEHFAQAAAEGRLISLELEAIEQILSASAAIPDGMLLTVNASGPTIEAFATAGQRLDARLTWGLELNEESAPELCARARSYADLLGCLLLIDDAGVGYATAERIMLLKPNIVKLDRTMIGRYASSECIRDLVDSLLEAARRTGAKTLAEGVETEEHLELVQLLGFDYAQGYYFSPGLLEGDLAAGMRDLGRRVGIDIPCF
ncbi:EAL domain-containing protein [Glutamicibacter ectropisis]|uniref:EAL domain-containing protein n=1 Tax=Glutamicibacter ectropisis TaxID=3046593 RepID=A0AAU6WDF4_9MICC